MIVISLLIPSLYEINIIHYVLSKTPYLWNVTGTSADVEPTVHGGDFSGNDVQKVVGNYQDIVNVVLEYRYRQNGNGVNYYM